MQRIVSYIRDENRNPIATLVAIPVSDNKFAIGFSQKHRSDIFVKKRGIEIAIGRAEAGVSLTKFVQQTKIGFEELNEFIARSRRYFKDRELINKD